jgi:drug/metabolite transporter (DMT)-like permease
MSRSILIILMMVAASVGYISSVGFTKDKNMDTINMLVVIWLIIGGIYMPFYMRNKREKLKGVTYKQFVLLCMAMAVGGLCILIFHYLGKR